MAKGLGAILLEKKLITRDKLELALLRQKLTKCKLGEILVALHLVNEEDIAKALAEQLPGWNYYDQTINVNIEILNAIGLEKCREDVLLPVYLDNGTETAFIFADPYNTKLTDELKDRDCTKKLRACFITTRTRILSAIDEIDKPQEARSLETIAKEIGEQGITHGRLAEEFLEVLLKKAIKDGATDIHFEPSSGISDIRFRIDGVLYPIISLLREHHDSLVNILYNKANLNPEDFQKFHDQRITLVTDGKALDIRLSSVPCHAAGKTGAGICLRLFDTAKKAWPLNALGYNQDQITIIRKIIRKPFGMMLITGPTGSGKTTTLYTILSELKSVRTKIVTIEDPIEMMISLVQQNQVDEKREITFGKALRSILRHDPDIILVGEIRDEETAQQAVRAAITGHLVFSTLHTKSAAESVLRLTDLGVSPEYLISSLVCLASQRLARKLCPKCKKEVAIGDLPQEYREIAANSFYFKSKSTVYVAGECADCVEGYRGRCAIAEIFPIIAEMHPFILHPNPTRLAEIARSKTGFVSLQRDGLRRIAEGITSFEEIERVVGFEE